MIQRPGNRNLAKDRCCFQANEKRLSNETYALTCCIVTFLLRYETGGMSKTIVFQGDSITDTGRCRKTREANAGLGSG